MHSEHILLQKQGFDYFIKPQLLTDVFTGNHFTDVTLVCDGDKQIKAHKVIIGSCSQFFKNILLKNPHNNPLIYLRGIKFEILEAIVKFVYLGETKVRKEDVDLFLDAIKDLEIDGFEELNNTQKQTLDESVEMPEQAHENDDVHETNLTEATNIVEPLMMEDGEMTDGVHDLLKNTEDSNLSAGNNDECIKVLDDNTEPGLQAVEIKDQENSSAAVEIPNKKMCLRLKFFDEISISNFGENANEMLTSAVNFYKCEQCEYSGVGRSVLKKHIQDNHGYPCDQCTYIGTSKGNFWKHKRSNH